MISMKKASSTTTTNCSKYVKERHMTHWMPKRLVLLHYCSYPMMSPVTITTGQMIVVTTGVVIVVVVVVVVVVGGGGGGGVG